MADNNNSKAPTHSAFAFRREGRKFGRWLEVGTGRADKDGLIRVYLDRTPINGFSGFVLLTPIGTRPPPPEPERPGQSDGDEAED